MSRYHYHLNLIFLLVSFLSFTSNFFLMVPTTPNDIRAFASFRTIIHLYYNIKTFFFSILHHHFLKISTLDYLFYVLLYSNNHFLYLFFFVPIFFCYFPLFSKQTNNSNTKSQPNQTHKSTPKYNYLLFPLDININSLPSIHPPTKTTHDKPNNLFPHISPTSSSSSSQFAPLHLTRMSMTTNSILGEEGGVSHGAFED